MPIRDMPMITAAVMRRPYTHCVMMIAAAP
jgi:hypothetical protein